MKDKKGFLLAEETLKIVIAVICIGFLVYFLVSLYFANKSSKDLEQAEASLNYLMEEIDAGRTEIEIYNPKGWVIGVWPHDTTKGLWYTVFIISETKEGLPKYCENIGWESCICICNKNDKDTCDKLGFCLENDLGIDIEEKNIEIKEVPLNLEIKNNIIIKK